MRLDASFAPLEMIRQDRSIFCCRYASDLPQIQLARKLGFVTIAGTTWAFPSRCGDLLQVVKDAKSNIRRYFDGNRFMRVIFCRSEARSVLLLSKMVLDCSISVIIARPSRIQDRDM
jgi:hypothetical protein